MGAGHAFANDRRRHVIIDMGDEPDYDFWWQDFDADMMAFATPSFWAVEREYIGRDIRVIAKNRLYWIGVHADSYNNAHLLYGVREDCPCDEFAAASLWRNAEAFFDRVQLTYALRVASSAWTSEPRTPSKAA